MDFDTHQIEYETFSPVQRAVKKAIVNPFANYAPAGFVKALLRWGESELAQASWSDPGGWRSMVISYEGNPEKLADRILVGAGTIPTALRNRKRLAAHLLARLIENESHEPVHVIGLGAGPGMIITEGMTMTDKPSRATMVDISSDAFEFGRQHAGQLGLEDRVRFIECDVRDVEQFLDSPPDVMMMMGICEYLDDEDIVSIASAAAEIMPAGKPIVFNSISRAHGTDRFFRRVFGLHMRHRSPEQLQALMRRAGFDRFEAFAEPLGVYHVNVGRRSSRPLEPTGGQE
jgi:predicted RNA methylase